MAYYLVERYVPSMSGADLAAAIRRVEDEAGDGVRHVWTVVVGAEDTCLSVFEGPDAESVRGVNLRAGFHLDRVVEVTSLSPGRRQGSD